jgi:hypothetical protein
LFWELGFFSRVKTVDLRSGNDCFIFGGVVFRETHL